MAKKVMGWKTPKSNRKVETTKPATSKAVATKKETKPVSKPAVKRVSKPKRSKFAMSQDAKIKAKKPGWRTAANGNEYYEARPNRSDENRKKKPFLQKGGYLEGREEYEGYKYLIGYRAPKGYSVSGGDESTKKLFDNEGVYFENYDDAKEHAEISIRSVTDDDYVMKQGGSVKAKMAKKDLEKYKYYLSREEELSNAYDEAESEYGEDSDDAKDAWKDLGSHLKSMRTFEQDMIKQYGKDFYKQYDSYVDGKMKEGGSVGSGLESKKIEIYGFEYFLNIKDSNKFEFKGEDGIIAKGNITSKGFHVTNMKQFDTVIALQDMIISLGEEDKEENYTLKTKNDYIHLTIDEGKEDKVGRQDIHYGDKLVATNNWDSGETLQKGTMDKNLAITVINDIMDCCGNKMKEGGSVGRSKWKLTIDLNPAWKMIEDEDDLDSFIEGNPKEWRKFTDKVVEILNDNFEKVEAIVDETDISTYQDIIDYIYGADDTQDFDYEMGRLYDIADENKIFVKTMYAKGGKMKDGGNTYAKEDKEMLHSQNKSVRHHSMEMDNVIDKQKHIEPWVVAKMSRATNDMSDLTHYLDGNKKRRGGGVGDIDSNIHMSWSSTKKITDDIRNFIFDSYEEAGQQLAADVIEAIEKGIEFAKIDIGI
jgi:hypothetical protein